MPDEKDISDESYGGKVLAIDFDGTLVERAESPIVGKDIPGAVDLLKKLMEEGWKILIHSHRAAQPDGLAQIAEWVEEHGLKDVSVVAKPYACWYIDDRAIDMDGGWSGIYEKLHTSPEVPEKPMPAVLSSAVRMGRYGMREITTELGFDYNEFRQDVRSAHMATTPHDRWVVSNAFREKYGMDVSVEDLSAAEYPDDYWRGIMAGVLERREQGNLQPGDDVVLLASGSNFGRLGNVMSVAGDAVQLALDGVANQVVTAHRKQIEILSGIERRSLLRVGAAINTPSLAWYRSAGARIHRALHGAALVTTHRVAGKTRVCRAHGSTGDFSKDVNISNLEAVYADYSGPTAKAVAVRISADDPHLNVLVNAAHIADTIKDTDQYVTNVRVIASTESDAYVVAEYAQPWARAMLVNQVGKLVATSSTDNGFAPDVAAGVMHIDIGTRFVPAAYSVNPALGTVYFPMTADAVGNFKETSARELSRADGHNG